MAVIPENDVPAGEPQGQPGFLDPEVLNYPFPFYQLLQEQAPVFQVPEMGFWVVSRYDDVMRVLKDDETFSSSVGHKMGSGFSLNPPRASVDAILAEGYPHVDTLSFLDPPEHTRQRALVSQAFTPRRVRLMQDTLRLIAEELIKPWPGHGEVEFVGKFTAPLAISAIGTAMGVDASETDRFRVWSDAVMRRLSSVLTEEEDIAEARRVVEFHRYMDELVKERRGGGHDDMLSDLINARVEGEQPLSMTELVNIILILLVAGNITSRSAMTTMMLELVKQPDLMAQVREDRSLIGKAFDETLRLQSPVMLFTRVTTREVELGGVKIPVDELVMPLFHAANVDPSHFPEPLMFKLDRPNLKSHLGFGFGVHYCIGAALGRAEADIAFNLLFDRFYNFELAAGTEPSYKANFWHREIAELPLVVQR